MARRIVAYTSRWPRRWRVLFGLVIAVGTVMYLMRPLQAVHDTGLFQLDGDAAFGTNTAGTPTAINDWDNVCYTVATRPTAQGGLGLSANDAAAKCGINTGVASSATAASWVEEPNPASTIFTGGGSKDPEDISKWLWKDDQNNPPDKDNLVHAYAVRYSIDANPNCPAGSNPSGKCEVIYFGSDRFDNSGDAQQAFWFLQNKVTLSDVKSGGGFKFTGVHKLGDLLVISDFSNGGTVSTITVYKWDPACTADGKPDLSCKAANLRLLQDLQGAPAKCTTAQNTDIACGLVNPSPITMPFTFVDKTNTPDNGALNGEFYEAGINLSQLNLGGECFSTVVSETRSSTSPTATLKDFVVGQFAVCAAGLSTTPSATAVAPGVSVTDTATVLGTGSSNPPTPTGNVTFFLCGPMASGLCTPGATGETNLGSVALSGTGALATAVSAAVNTAQNPLAVGRYCFRAEWPGDANYPGTQVHTGTADSECFVVTVISTATTSAQTWLPNDSGTVTAATATALNGTLSFTLYEGGTCSGTVLRTAQTFTLSAAASPQTRSTTNTTVSVETSKTVSWLVVWDSTDPGVGDSSHCETTALTITN
jgi:hypothetical protein